VTSCTIDSALYYGGQKQKFALPPPPQLSLHRRAALATNSNGTQSAHKGKRGGGEGGRLLLQFCYNDMTACGSGFAVRKYKRRKEHIKKYF
jgi:hypothetical protein